MNIVWTEKYRPKFLKDVIGVPITITKVIEKPEQLPHLLLFSKQPGTGKTTIAKAIINDLNAESLIMNASDERRIEDIREKVKRFVQTGSLNGGIKIVFLDECDGMIKGSQEALRNLMESYNAKFIITANNIEKIIKPLQSRCLKINLQAPNKNKIALLLADICKNENIECEHETFSKLINIHYPSIRDMINQLQSLSMDGKIKLSDIKQIDDKYMALYNKFKKGKIPEIRQEWLENGYELNNLLKHFFEYIFADDWSIGQKKQLLDIIAEANYRMAVNADPDITMFWAIMKMRSIIK